MLIACASCHRQYDVEGMSVGDHVRCRCGQLCTVPKRRPQEARMLHCSGCGGKLESRAKSCVYCGAQVAASDRNLGPACPECFSRMAVGAGFCSACGVKIQPEALKRTRSSATCPRCKGALVHREAENVQYTECGACGGFWLDSKSFEAMVSRRDAAAIAPLLRGAPPTTGQARDGEQAGVEPTDKVAYLPCPTCGTLMNRRNFAGCSGIIIDWCKGHGFWFDAFELEKVVAFVQDGGLDKARIQDINRAKRQLQRLEDNKKSLARAGAGWSVDARAGSDDSLASWLVTIGDIAGSVFRFFR